MILAATVSVLAVTRACADDIPYLGPLAGLGNLPAPLSWLLPNYKTDVVPDWSGFTVNPLINYQTAQFTGAGGRFLRSARGFTLGGELGYNIQVDRFVFGPVVDLSYSLMRAKPNSWIANINKADISWVGSARVRAGYTFDRFMIYATGGVAFAQTNIDGPFVSSSQTAPGWTAGAGVQYLWSPSDIFQIEYRRVQISNEEFVALPRFQTKAGLAMNIINAGFIFNF